MNAGRNKTTTTAVWMGLLLTALISAGCTSTPVATPKGNSAGNDSVIEVLQERSIVEERDILVDDDGRIIEETNEVAVGPVLPSPEGPAPIRLPAQIMRIWIAPWEDNAGNLHAPGLVFTEIEPRRWTIGVKGAALASRTILTPLQVEDRTAQPQK